MAFVIHNVSYVWDIAKKILMVIFANAKQPCCRRLCYSYNEIIVLMYDRTHMQVFCYSDMLSRLVLKQDP